MNAIRRPLLVLAALSVIVVAGCGSGSGSVSKDAVAVVDGVEIPRTELDALIDRARGQYKAGKKVFPKAGTTDFQALQGQAVSFLVKREQNEQEAKRLSISVADDEIAKKFGELRTQFFGGDQKKFDEALKKQGTTKDELELDIRAQLLSEKLTAKAVEGVTVSDAEAKKYYDDNIAQYTKAESRDVRHILLAVKTAAGAAKVDFPKSLVLANDVRAQLVAGGDFAVLAKKYSDDPGSKDNGGKYPGIARGQFVPEFEKAMFSLDTNELSQPIKTDFGYHLIEPTSAVKSKSVEAFAKVEAQIKSQLLDTRNSERVATWAAELTKSYEGKVKYTAGFEPPAASTDTQPSG
jgi:parvulin-like peptidyl-prolyl isomerase